MSAAQAVRRGLWWLALAGVVLFALVAGLIDSAEALVRHLAAFQLFYGLAFAGYVWLVWSRAVTRGRDHPQEAVVLLTAAIALRLLAFSGPSSEQLYRYLWEGRVQLDGWNPYAAPPNDDRMAHLRDERWAAVAHPAATATQPPLLEMVFAAVAWVYPACGSIKLALLGSEVAALLALAGWARAVGRSAAWVGVYGLAPLTLVAFAMEGHPDGLMLLWIALAGWASLRRRWYACGACLGLAVLSKAVAVVLLVWLLVRNPRGALMALAVILIGYLPYSAAGPGLLGSFHEFTSGPLFNSLVPQCLAPVMGAWSAAALCMVALCCYVLWLATCRQLEMHEFGARAFGVMLILLPAVRYWYVSWVLLFAVLGLRWRWVVLCGAMLFYFDVWGAHARTDVWHMPVTSQVLIWVPLVVAWAAEEGWRAWNARQDQRYLAMRMEPYEPFDEE